MKTNTLKPPALVAPIIVKPHANLATPNAPATALVASKSANSSPKPPTAFVAPKPLTALSAPKPIAKADSVDRMNANINKKWKGKGNGKGKEKKKYTKSSSQLTPKTAKTFAPTCKSERLNTHRASKLLNTTYENPFTIDNGGETAKSMCMQKSMIDIAKKHHNRETTFLKREPLRTHRFDFDYFDKVDINVMAMFEKVGWSGLVDEEEYEVGEDVLSDNSHEVGQPMEEGESQADEEQNDQQMIEVRIDGQEESNEGQMDEEEKDDEPVDEEETEGEDNEDEVQGVDEEKGPESGAANEEEVADAEGQENGIDGYEPGVHWSDEVEDVHDHDHGINPL
ncbi:hypothetical protein Sjap_019941 [Stephania japonica]|uniref:Uncharacterized protein n=1 Tax=Stephania japonica TaxID=461633 RepID=A0AAP0HYK5_9MAGN